ncbi:MAG: hypothetical protein ISS56_19670, partial [Anaerolineae bacterium]|nr:hypothetical protein [Anaerolineae bacterium]
MASAPAVQRTERVEPAPYPADRPVAAPQPAPRAPEVRAEHPPVDASPQPELGQEERQEQAPAAPQPAPEVAPQAGVGGDPVAERILALVSEKTGYPPDMLDLDLDLEADLGIDTVKQAEVFASIREAYDIPRRDDIKLRDYDTLSKVIAFVHESRPDLAASAPAPVAPAVPTVRAAPSAPQPAPEVAPQAGEGGDPVAERILALVSEKTGYPPDMLDLDLDLEADLGIDTVKQAEVFASIREAYDIPRRDDIKLRDYDTLSKVIAFVHESRPDLAASAP